MSAERKQVQVVKSNHVIEASYRLSIAEQRIVLFCITQIRRDQPMMTGMNGFSFSAAVGSRSWPYLYIIRMKRAKKNRVT